MGLGMQEILILGLLAALLLPGVAMVCLVVWLIRREGRKQRGGE